MTCLQLVIDTVVVGETRRAVPYGVAGLTTSAVYAYSALKISRPALASVHWAAGRATMSAGERRIKSVQRLALAQTWLLGRLVPR